MGNGKEEAPGTGRAPNFKRRRRIQDPLRVNSQEPPTTAVSRWKGPVSPQLHSQPRGPRGLGNAHFFPFERVQGARTESIMLTTSPSVASYTMLNTEARPQSTITDVSGRLSGPGTFQKPLPPGIVVKTRGLYRGRGRLCQCRQRAVRIISHPLRAARAVDSFAAMTNTGAWLEQSSIPSSAVRSAPRRRETT